MLLEPGIVTAMSSFLSLLKSPSTMAAAPGELDDVPTGDAKVPFPLFKRT
jgi:hypothetical protein